MMSCIVLADTNLIEAQLGSGVRNRGRPFSCGRVWAKRDEKNAKG
jgi:hypothetical protein